MCTFLLLTPYTSYSQIFSVITRSTKFRRFISFRTQTPRLGKILRADETEFPSLKVFLLLSLIKVQIIFIEMKKKSWKIFLPTYFAMSDMLKDV